MTGNYTPFIDWQLIWKNHSDLKLARRWNKRSNFAIWPNHPWILLWVYHFWHIFLSIRILHGGCEIMYFDTRMWPFHYTYLQPSYVKPLFPRFGNFFTIIEEQKHGGILTMLTIFRAVVIGFANIVYIRFLPVTTLLVLLKTFRFLPIFGFFSQPMRILHIFTADNHSLSSLHSELRHGPNNMGLPPFTDEEIHSFFRRTMVTPYPRVDSESSLYISKNQTPSTTMASIRSHITSWWSWASKTDGVLSTTVFSRCLEHMEWSRLVSSTTFDLWWSSKYHWTIHSPYSPEKIQMGHQYPLWFAIWFRLLKKEETIQEGPYIDFLLSKQIRETSSGYSPHHWLYAVTTLAPNYGTTGRASDLANSSSFSVRYTVWMSIPTCGQWWSSWISSIQFHKIDFLMQSILWFWNGDIVTQTLSFLSTCHKGAIHYNFPMLVKFTKPQRRPRWFFRTIFLRLYRDRCHAIFSKPSMLFGNRSEEQE